MSDLISRADAIEAVDELPTKDTPIELYEVYRMAINDAEWAIDALPSADAVEVVRCKDCRDSRVYGKTTQWLACESVMEGQATDPDGYCYLGERKEGSEVEE